jgi:hypothetical protein
MDLNVFLGLGRGGSIFPVPHGSGCGLYEDGIAAQCVHSCYFSVGEYGHAQANQASNVSVFETLGIFRLDAADDPPVGFLD